jgi:hypothetical protein
MRHQSVLKLILTVSTGGHFAKDFFAGTGTFCGASEDEAEGLDVVTALTLST